MVGRKTKRPEGRMFTSYLAERASVSVELQAVLSRINHRTHQIAKPHEC